MPRKAMPKAAATVTEPKKQKATIDPEKMRHVESVDEKTRKLENQLSNRLTRGEMSTLLDDRSKEVIDQLAERFKVTAEDVNKCLDLIAFQRQL